MEYVLAFRGNNVNHSRNTFEEEQERYFLKKNGIYALKLEDNLITIFMVIKIPKDFSKTEYQKFKEDFRTILYAEYDKYKDKYAAICLDLHDDEEDEKLTKNILPFFSVEKKDFYTENIFGLR
mgnify:CR=1 FL=1